MSYVQNGITIDGYRPNLSPAAGTAAGAVGALGMATVWCAIAHFARGDASLPIRAISATLLGHPTDEDPLRTAVAIALGLFIHLAMGMMLGHALERAAHDLPSQRAPRGALLLSTVGLGLVLSMGPLEKLAPAFASTIPPLGFVAAHALFGSALELRGLFRGKNREIRSKAFRPEA